MDIVGTSKNFFNVFSFEMNYDSEECEDVFELSPSLLEGKDDDDLLEEEIFEPFSLINANTCLHKNEGMQKTSISHILKRHNTESHDSQKLYFRVKTVAPQARDNQKTQRTS